MLTNRSTLAFGRQLCERLCFSDNTFVRTTRAYSVDHEKQQHLWREKEHDAVTFKLGDDPEKPKRFFWFPTAAPREKYSIINIAKWFEYHKVEFTKSSQAFNPQRHSILGADLATAHFLVYRGGRVKFRNNIYWTEKDKEGSYNLPDKYDPNYTLEAADANGYDLYYEGLSNFCGLVRLKWLSLKNCKNIDDWGLDKISSELPALEYLDISGCEKITERGLECLYRMINLKKLIVTNHHKSVAFELSCFMLEDCIPGLTCEILMPEEKSID